MKTKKCFRCNKVKAIDLFYKHKLMGDGYLGKCIDCTKKEERDRRNANIEKARDYDVFRYRNSESRIQTHKYAGIVNRSLGKGSHKYSVEGKRYLTANSFKKWWKDNRDTYLKLHKQWVESNYSNKLAPSIDRIDNKKGYMPSNMQWMTLSENTSKYNK